MKLQLLKTIRSVFMLLLSVGSFSLMAQSDPTGESAVTRTFAITNATVIPAPGKELKNTTVLIKNGLIEAVGTNLSIPNGAQVIDAEGMYVYPAFIDGLSTTGAKRPDNPQRPNNLFTPDPPNDYAGITPEQSVLAQIDTESNAIEQLRNQGFGISHVVPFGRMLPGSGSLMLLSNKGHVDQMMLLNDVSMFTQFTGAPGAYPGNTLGIMAKWRNLYRNAELSKQHTDMYAQNPSGIERPERDRVSEAFYPVLSKEQPVFFDVSGVLEIQRAMRLQKDLGFKLMVANVKQAWDLVDQFKANGTGVFLSLDLPDAPKAIKDEDKAKLSDEAKGLEDRRNDFYKKYVTQAAELSKAGVKFGFSTLDVTNNKIKANLLVLLENGLSESDLLAALTTSPASILGIDKMAGTLEKGKIANVMVSNAPYFTKDAQIRYMFVDGDKYDLEIKERSTRGNGRGNAGPAAGNDPISGTWTYTFESPQGETSGKLTFRLENGAYAGSISSSDGQIDTPLSNISFSNNTLTFDFSFDAGGQGVDVVVSGPVTGKEFDATMSIDAFNFSTPMKATKDDARQ